MSGGDGKDHNGGSHTSGGVNGTSGKGGPSGGGVDASDHSGWSKENNPWGGGGTIGGDQHGNGGGQGSNQGNNNNTNQGISVLKPGESYMNPWGMVIVDANGHPTMNGIVMTEGNSSLVPDGTGGFTRALNSLTGVKNGYSPVHGGGGLTAIPEYNTNNYPNTGGFPPVGDANWKLNPPKWSIREVQSQNSAWQSYITHVEGLVYKLTFDRTGKLVDTAYVNYDPVDDTRYSPIKSFEYNKKTAEKQVRDAIDNENKLSQIAKDNIKKEDEAVKDAVKFTADFYKQVFNVYGEKAEQLAKLLASQAKGKKIRNAQDALKSYEKYKANINKKINAKDREAIAKALESVDIKEAAKNIKKFSKGLGYVGPAIDAVDLFNELVKAVKTDNWRSFFVKVETIVIGFTATELAALAFGAILGGPVGILGYGFIIAGVGALVNETIVDEANKIIGI